MYPDILPAGLGTFLFKFYNYDKRVLIKQVQRELSICFTVTVNIESVYDDFTY